MIQFLGQHLALLGDLFLCWVLGGTAYVDWLVLKDERDRGIEDIETYLEIYYLNGGNDETDNQQK